MTTAAVFTTTFGNRAERRFAGSKSVAMVQAVRGAPSIGGRSARRRTVSVTCERLVIRAGPVAPQDD